MTPKVAGATVNEALQANNRYSGDIQASLPAFQTQQSTHLQSWEAQKEEMRKELQSRSLAPEARTRLAAELEQRLALADQTRGNEQLYRNIGFSVKYLGEMQSFYRTKYIESVSRFPVLVFFKDVHENQSVQTAEFSQDLKQALDDVKLRANNFLRRLERNQPQDFTPEVFKADPPRNPRPSKSAFEVGKVRKYSDYETPVSTSLAKKPQYCSIAHKVYKSLVAYEKSKAYAKNAVITVASTGCGLIAGLPGYATCFSLAAGSAAYDIMKDFAKSHRDIEYEFGRVRNSSKLYQQGIAKISDEHKKKYIKAVLRAVVLAKAVIPGGDLINLETGSAVTDAVLENVAHQVINQLRNQGVTAVIEGKNIVRLDIPSGNYATFADYQKSKAPGQSGPNAGGFEIKLDVTSLIRDILLVGGSELVK